MSRPPHFVTATILALGAVTLAVPTASGGGHPSYRAVTGAGAGAGAGGGAASTCDGTWRHVAGSQLEYEYASDMLVLGSTHVYATGPRSGLARWTGRGWVFSQITGVGFPEFLAGSAPDDLWAFSRDDFDTSRQLRHFDGTSWDAVPLPTWLEGDDFSLFDMVRAGGQLWTLSYRSADGRQPLLGRYDGSAWHVVPGDLARSADSEPTALAVGPNGRVWLAGRDITADDAGRPTSWTPYAARVVNGQVRRLDLPADGTRIFTTITTLAWAANSDLVIGGYSGDPTFRRFRPYLARRHDGVWTRMTHPQPIVDDLIVDVVARVGGRLYAGLSSPGQARFARIDGTTFSLLPGPYHQDAFFVGMAGVPGGDGFAITQGEADVWLSRLC